MNPEKYFIWISSHQNNNNNYCYFYSVKILTKLNNFTRVVSYGWLMEGLAKLNCLVFTAFGATQGTGTQFNTGWCLSFWILWHYILTVLTSSVHASNSWIKLQSFIIFFSLQVLVPVYLGRPRQALVVPRLISPRVQLQLVCLEPHLQTLVEVYLERHHLEASLDRNQLHNVSGKYNVYTCTSTQCQGQLLFLSHNLWRSLPNHIGQPSHFSLWWASY